MLHKPEKPHHKCAVTCARRAKHTSTSTPTINYPWFYDLSCSRASNRLLCSISACRGICGIESRNEKARDGDLSGFERFVWNKFLFPFSTFRTHRLWHITSLCSFSHFSEPRSDRLALNGLSFLSLYICWPLVSRLKRSKMMYASERLFRQSFLSFGVFSEHSDSLMYDLLVWLCSRPLWRSSESGLQTRLLEILRLHRTACPASRTTRRLRTRASFRCDRARHTTTPTASSWSTPTTIIAGGRRMIRMFHLTIDYPRPKNNAWY